MTDDPFSLPSQRRRHNRDAAAKAQYLILIRL